MKKISKYTIALFLAVVSTAGIKIQAQSCNQVEILYQSPDCYKDDHTDPNGGAGGGKGCKPIGVCVNSPYTYTSSVTGTGWSYLWSVTGPTSVTISPNNTSSTVNIVWPQVGTYTLTLTATDPSGNVFTYCLTVNVKAKPVANFTFTPNNVCQGSTISFTGTSTYSGSFMSSWNFGDPPSGSYNYTTVSGNATVTHQYNSPGTYTVTLIVYSFTLAGGSGLPNEPPSIKTCCADTIKKQVTIKPGTLNIQCVSTVCPGDTVKYTAVGCSNVTWLPVVGGTMISSTSTTITIVWGNGNPQGQIQAQCPGGCIASVPVPIIPTTPIIIGNTSPCNTSTTSYTLPVLPGTFYTWTLTNISTATNYNNLLNTFPDNNTVWINWASAPAGTYQLTINLENKHICCSSSGSLIIIPSDKWTAYYDQTVCTGPPGASLSTFPAAGTFSWTVLPPNTGASPLTWTGPTFNPVFTNGGSYIVEVTETANTYCNSGPTNPQQIKITVISTPAPGIINGPATACVGSNTNYSMSTNAPAGFHYEWSVTGGCGTFQPGNLPTTTGNSATIQWTSLPCVISVVLAANGYPACPSPAVIKNVGLATVGSISCNPNPACLNVCVDGTGSYTLTGGNLPPGEIITWSIAAPYTSLGTIISGQGTNSITILWHGQPTGGPWGPVTINASTGCGNAIPLTGIMIYPKFSISITKTGTDICNGGVNLTANGAPLGSAYLWSSGQTTSSISGILLPGTYTVTATYPATGGCFAQASYVVEDPFAIMPVTCNVGYCNGTSTNEVLGVTVVKPLVGTFTYQWYNGTYNSGTAISGATSPTYTTPSYGNYYVIVTYGSCTRYLNFTVKKVCCPDVNHPQITSVVRLSCNTFTFTGTTANPGGDPITWSFGNGVTAPGVSGVPYTYTYPPGTLPGDYCVTFCVGSPTPNPTNCTGNCAVTVVRVPLLAAFTYKLGCNGCLSITNLSAVLPTSNAATATYNWDFGDGSPIVTTLSATPPAHCYTSPTPNTYTITLTINYSDPSLGITCSSTATQTVNWAPLAINVNPSPVCTGVQTTFSILGSPSFTILTYTWNFGDGFTAYTPSSTHIYNSSGPFNVTLTIVDALGNTCTANSTVNVLAGIGPCTILPGFICPGGVATLTAPNISGATYQWEIESSPGIFTPAPGVNNTMIYTTNVPGFYHVVITGPNGCKCTSNKVEVKTVTKPKAIIAASPSSRLCGPGSVMLSSPNHLTGYTSQWWDASFSSMLYSGMMYPTPVITSTTVYNLILINEYGCPDTCSLTIYVNPIPAQPVIIYSPTLCEGVPITLTVTNYANNITWNTGSNTTSITVTSAGVYTATYTDPVTGCSSSSNIKINRRPPVDLFPHFCDSIPCICRDSTGAVTLYAPKPLIGAYAATYNIQWYFNGNPVGGNTLTYSPATSGTYYIVVTDPMTTCVSTSPTYTIIVPKCDTCDCKESHWGEISLTEGEMNKTKGDPVHGADVKVGAKSNINNNQGGNPIILKCKSAQKLDCNKIYTINASFNCKDTACPPKVTYNLQPPTGPATSGNVPASFTTTMNGVYILTLYGWCGNKICDSCIIDLTVKCDTVCDCKGSKWGEKMYSTGGGVKTFECNKTYQVKCNQPVTVNATYICPDPNSCPSNVTYSLQPPAGSSTTGNAPLTFTPNLPGTYTVVLYGWCGNSKCDSCIIKFKTDCIPVDTTCCHYSITVDAGPLTYTQQFNATIAAQNFTIYGLAGVPLTEVRAEVLSYTIKDNYNKECMKCISLPYTWASVLSAGNLVSIPPKITMYNSTVHPFNPTGAGQYQNPREVVWNNGNTFTINNGTLLGMNFILPPTPVIDCCELKGRICVKFTFRDNNCNECEVIACFAISIKKK